MLLVAAIDQRSADRAAILADQPCAGLDDADRITGPPVADLRIGHEEGIENAGRGRFVIGGNGAVEVHRRLRDEVEHRRGIDRSEEHTSELQSLMRISYAVFCLKKKNNRLLDTGQINQK